jgi:hypothetical protein
MPVENVIKKIFREISWAKIAINLCLTFLHSYFPEKYQCIYLQNLKIDV